MLDHESQWLLRSAFIRGSFIPLTAPAMMVMEITEFHPYHISDVSHFYALYFCLVFIMWTLPLDSSPTEYQINSFRDSFRKGSPIYPRDSHCSTEGKNTQKPQLKPEAAAVQSPQTTAPDNDETPRLRHGDYSGSEPDSLAEQCPSLLLTPNQNCYTLSTNPQQQFTASLLLFTLKSVSRNVSGLFRHPYPGKYLPSRGTRNTDVAFVNSALKNGSSNSSFSSVLLYFSPPDSLWWCYSLFLYSSHPSVWQLQSFPHITHTVTLP